jgi:hypothetical protein
MPRDRLPQGVAWATGGCCSLPAATTIAACGTAAQTAAAHPPVGVDGHAPDARPERRAALGEPVGDVDGAPPEPGGLPSDTSGDWHTLACIQADSGVLLIEGAVYRVGCGVSDDCGELGGGMQGVLVSVQSSADADAADVDRLMRRLRADLLEVDIDSVAAKVPEGIPEGAKGEPASWCALLITLSSAGGVFPLLINVIRDWLGRQPGQHRIVVTIDGDSIELDKASARERSDLIDVYVRRHTRE